MNNRINSLEIGVTAETVESGKIVVQDRHCTDIG